MNETYVVVFHPCYYEGTDRYAEACRVYPANDPYLKDNPNMYELLEDGFTSEEAAQEYIDDIQVKQQS